MGGFPYQGQPQSLAMIPLFTQPAKIQDEIANLFWNGKGGGLVIVNVSVTLSRNLTVPQEPHETNITKLIGRWLPIVVVTGSKWQLRDLRRCYGLHIIINRLVGATYVSVTVRNGHNISTYLSVSGSTSLLQGAHSSLLVSATYFSVTVTQTP